jgi:hypothetical protein
MQNAILHIDRGARLWWCAVKRDDALEKPRASLGSVAS